MSTSAASISTLDPPFLSPLETVVDLPFPPSVNRIWRATAGPRTKGNIYRSPEYKAWIAQANFVAIADRAWRSKARMPANFTAQINLDRTLRAGDLDNRVKAVMDWAQAVRLITNDKLCDDLRVRWAPPHEAPQGCRLILTSIA